MTEQLSVCFVWHMHQPLYKDRLTGRYLMPWVRLHAIKDYLDMPLILKDFPKIRQTFNLVPSLIEQLEDYAWHEAVDEQLILTCKDENDYTLADKISILAESFHANLEHQIKPHPPYLQLYLKRQNLQKQDKTFAMMADEFSVQEYADMATWMNLGWFDPIWYDKIPEIKRFILQGTNFELAQRKRIIQIQRELIQKTISTYKELQDDGHIEVITSPYYHPILPLLIDSNEARLPNPYTSLPQRVYLHKKDADAQLSSGLRLYKDKFGRSARGMWPSEMSVSPQALDLIAQHGIQWVVLDEALLSKTLDRPIGRDPQSDLVDAELICQPYRLNIGDESINVFFREVVLSNEISFSYAYRSAEDSANTLYNRLKSIQKRLVNWDREGVVVIALDGENCWETYEQDGNIFLQEIYRRLSQDNTLKICTISDYLDRNPPSRELFNIHSGSWIGADFHIWIGDPLKNKAWDLLGITRRFLFEQLNNQEYLDDVKAQAWEAIYAAEGSDWFWWFGEPNNSEHDAMFDLQFRLCLQNVYKVLGCNHPENLDVSVLELVSRESKHPHQLAFIY